MIASRSGVCWDLNLSATLSASSRGFSEKSTEYNTKLRGPSQLMKKLRSITLAVLLPVGTTKADIGWTYAQCVRAWGEPIQVEMKQVQARTYYAVYFVYTFKINNGSALLVVSMRDGRVIEQSDPLVDGDTDFDD